MRIGRWTLTRTPPPREIVGPGASYEAKPAPALLERLNQVESRLERVEMDSADRQLRVLTAVEKVMHQLRAREAKRARENGGEVEVPAGAELDGPVVDRGPGPAPSALLARRFRRF